MSAKTKYQAVLDLGEQFQMKDGSVSEEGGILKIKGLAATPYEKNVLWDKIKELGGDSPADIKANISVADETIYHRHTVASGETLGKIAAHYYESASKYTAIFEANTDQLKNPDMINVGQVLVIPNL